MIRQMAGLLRRDDGDDSGSVTYDTSTFILIILVLLAGSCMASIILIRRRRQRRILQSAILPYHRRQGHQRTLTIATTPSSARGESIFVYDEKMNLIANSHGPPDSRIPEIRVTFPDEDNNAGQRSAGRVVVLRISETGSEGMEPLQQEALPPYQTTDAGHFQSLDLERIGGLREKTQVPTPRYS